MKGVWEKMYNEALERARKLKEMYPQDAPGYEEVFPELAESEDERIRKWILEKVQGYADSGIPCSDEIQMANKAIAYLEKQKETLHISETYKENADSFTDEDERLRKELCSYLLKQLGRQKDNLMDAKFDEWFAWLEKQKEHQETCTTFLAKILKHSAEGFRNVLKKKGINYIPHESFWTNTARTFSKQECNEFYKWMDDMTMELVTEETPEYKKGFKDGLDASKKEQKPIKWTELTWKDIVELEGIINNVHYEFRNGIGQESFGKEVLEKFREYKGDEYLDEKEQKPIQPNIKREYIEKRLKGLIDKEGEYYRGAREELAHLYCILGGHPSPYLINSVAKEEWSENFDEEVEKIHKRYPEVSFAKLTRIAYHFSKWANKCKDIEWSEEDKIKLDNCCAVIAQQETYFDAYLRQKCLDFLYELPERFNLPPKQGWSEEEAKKAAEDYADEFPGMTHENDGSTIEDYDKPYEDFLAGVLWAKHRGIFQNGNTHWKPSEEQMEALGALNCHGGLSYIGQQNQLISLYNDLKKLKGGVAPMKDVDE